MSGDIEAFEAVLAQRYSCRAFRPEPVPREVLARILAAAQRVPSWCNAQPWEVTMCGPEATDRLRAALTAVPASAHVAPDVPFPDGYSGPRLARRREVGWQLYDAVGVAKGDRAGAARQAAENFRFFGAPQVAIVTTVPELGAYGVLDCGAFVTAVTLAAAAMGVASCPQASIAAAAGIVREVLGIGEERWIVCAIALGYADAAHPANGFRAGRAGPEEVVDWR